MAIGNRVVEVGTSPTKLNSLTSDEVAGSSLAVKNYGSAVVRIGKADVSMTTGYPLAPGEPFAVKLEPGESVYGICASGTVACPVFEQGV